MARTREPHVAPTPALFLDIDAIIADRQTEIVICCGAGGARMWMEEKIGKSINVERTDEALGLDPDIVSTACPFCMVMLSDAVTAKQQSGEAKDGVQVLDVSQILARSLVAPQPALVGAGDLVARLGGARAVGEHPEVVEPARHLGGAHGPHSGGGQLDAQRQPVEAPADLRDGRVRVEVRPGRPRPGDEQLGRVRGR